MQNHRRRTPRTCLERVSDSARSGDLLNGIETKSAPGSLPECYTSILLSSVPFYTIGPTLRQGGAFALSSQEKGESKVIAAVKKRGTKRKVTK